MTFAQFLSCVTTCRMDALWQRAWLIILPIILRHKVFQTQISVSRIVIRVTYKTCQPHFCKVARDQVLLSEVFWLQEYIHFNHQTLACLHANSE